MGISNESSCSLVISDPSMVFLILFRYFQNLPAWKSIQEQSQRQTTMILARLELNRIGQLDLIQAIDPGRINTQKWGKSS